MTTDVDFDVAVIGAGIAGCVTAYRLASQGHSVVLAERGAKPGGKNLSGGVLYCRVMEDVFPGFLKDAPTERQIIRNCLSFLSPTAFVNVDYRDERLGIPTNAVTVLRGKLDAWLAEQCEAAGVALMAGVKVDGLIMDDAQTVGIQADGEELRCHVVVAADGVNSFICREAGIRAKESTSQLALGVKSVVGLPRGVIEDRFNLTGNEGAAYAVVGDATGGIAGGGFMYTNVDSVSVGVVLRLDDLVDSGETSSDVHDRFLAHPAIKPFLKGGQLLEYGCHMVAEGGRSMVHDLTRPGLVVVGDAAGLTLNTGFTLRGMDLAAGSAIAAATTIDAALRDADYSQPAMDVYLEHLDAAFVGFDMDTYAKAPAFLKNPRMYKDYGLLLSDVLYGVYNLDTTPRKHLLATGRDALKSSPVTTRRLAEDAVTAIRAL